MNNPSRTFAAGIVIILIILSIAFIAWSSVYGDCEDHKDKPARVIPVNPPRVSKISLLLAKKLLWH